MLGRKSLVNFQVDYKQQNYLVNYEHMHFIHVNAA